MPGLYIRKRTLILTLLKKKQTKNMKQVSYIEELISLWFLSTSFRHAAESSLDWTLYCCNFYCIVQLYLKGKRYASRLRIIEPPRDKTDKMTVRPAKTQISLGIRPVWSESLLSAQWVAKDPSFLHAESEDSDQTGRMPRLIWVFAGCTTTLLVLSRGGSYYVLFI